MKTYPKRIYSFLLLSLFFITNCKKNASDNSLLPPATHNGAMTYACLINGKPWISKGGWPPASGIFINDTVGINGMSTHDTTPGMICDLTIFLAGVKPTTGTYRLNDTARRWARYEGFNSPCFDYNGSYGTTHSYATDGELTLTRLDTLTHIISGTFWFVVPTKYCDTIRVTDGRFDFQY